MRKPPAHPKRRKLEPNPYTVRIPKTMTKTECENKLRHAITHQDTDAFEDYDEPDDV